MREPLSPVRPLSSQAFPWYDSIWLSAFERARSIVLEVAPQRLKEFESAFQVLRTRPEFKVKVFEQVFDLDTLAEIRRVASTLQPAQLEFHEARAFRRFVVHDHPYFNILHQRTVDLVSEASGEPVEASYNFLSLYGPNGVCPLHLDAPLAKWTLDLCISQSDPWPIYFGPVAPWPQGGIYGADWEDAIKRDIGSAFESYTLSPGQAVLFSGTSQWHYRDPMPGSGPKKFCDLLFFHFIPAGTRELVDPANWARLFDVPELKLEGGQRLGLREPPV